MPISIGTLLKAYVSGRAKSFGTFGPTDDQPEERLPLERLARLSLVDATWLASIKGLSAGAVNLTLAFLLGARLPSLLNMVAALILGSHAMHDSFAMIRWGASGIAPGAAGLLWSLSVAAEVIVFFFVGRPLLDRLGPAGAAMLAAAAGIVRWATMAETAWLPAMAAIEPLHGLTFALLHLTCLRLLAENVPHHLAATALTIYGTVGIGVPTALLTLASGQLYAHFGAHGFWVMALFCAAALPVARALRRPAGEPS